MAALEAIGDETSVPSRGLPGVCRSAEDVELLDKLTAFTAAANRGEVIKALDAANLAFAHGMFKCGAQRTSVSNRAGILSQCAQRFLGAPSVSHLAKLSTACHATLNHAQCTSSYIAIYVQHLTILCACWMLLVPIRDAD